MNEPDEDLESTLPEEPLPERDFLLEALVDAETEATPSRRFSKTLIAACVLSGLGVWQIVHVSNGGEPIFQLATKAKAAPTKLRSDGREPIGRVLPSTDPIAAYLERAKRGMTDQEIRWMIEDFQTAGLDEDFLTGFVENISDTESESFARSHRAKQNAWYLAALNDALNLTPQQMAQTHAQLDNLLENDLKVLIDLWIEVENKYWFISANIRDFERPSEWLLKEFCAPWNLCDLSADQSQLTLRQWKINKDGSPIFTKSIDPLTIADDPFAIIADPQPVAWLSPSEVAIQDPATGTLIEFPKAPKFAYLMNYEGILPISDAFPLTPSQQLAENRGNLLAQVRLVQPAQLRMALLLNPGLASLLLNDFDQPSVILPDNQGTGVTTAPSAPTDELPPNTVQPETPVDPLREPDPK